MRAAKLALRLVVLSALLIPVAAVAQAGAAALIDVNGVPTSIQLPTAGGANVVVTASVPGTVSGDVWLSPDGPQEVRVLLREAGDGRYPVNLADPVVEAVLMAMPRPGAFRIYAETDEGVAASMAVRYSVTSRADEADERPAPAQGRFRLFVVSDGERREVGAYVDPTSDLYDDISWLMSSGGSGGYPFCSAAPRAYRPEDVDALEIDYRTPSGDAAAQAQVGKRNWRFVPDAEEARLRLDLDEELRSEWLERGAMTIYVSSGGRQREVAVLEVAPESLDLPDEGAQFTVTQRYTANVPGGDGYLRVRLGDITGGQVLVTLSAGQPTLVDARSMREDEEAAFSLGDKDYVLRLTRLVDVLVGNDFAQFVVTRAGETDLAVIHGLIRQVEKATLVFVRNGKEYGPHAAADHLRRKLDFASGEIESVEDFLTGVAARSWTTGEPYMVKLPDGTERSFEEWLRERVEEPE